MRKSTLAETFPVTSFLLLFMLAFFALEVILTWKLQGQFPRIFQGGIHPRVTWLLGSLRLLDTWEQDQYWRLLASAFLHGGFIHLFFNAFVLWDIGRLCEPLLSSWKFLVVYVASALGAGALSLLYSYAVVGLPQGHLRSSVGASGALAGLIGLLLVHAVRSGNREMRDALLRWIFIILVYSVIVRNVDHAGHLGGFLVGCAFGLTTEQYITSRAAVRWRVPAYIAGAACVVSLALAVIHFLDNRAVLGG